MLTLACECAWFSASQLNAYTPHSMPVTNNQTFPEFRVKVNDTTPLWFSAPDQCGQGMVFAVNSDEQGDRNSSAFQTLAKEINGTSSASSNGPSSTSSGSDGYGAAVHVSVHGITLAAVVASVAAFVL